MMIAIVILGLGLVMVGTIFPVAWDRARTLSEYTMEQAASSGAQTTLASLLRPASHSLIEIRSDDVPIPPPPPRVLNEELRLTGGSLAGDMFFDPTLPGILAFSDTSVHALDVENILFISTGSTVATVAENPWDLEDPGNPPGTNQIVQDRFVKVNYPNAVNPRNRGKAFPKQLFYGYDDDVKDYVHPQVSVWQRLYPPMEAPPAADDPDFEKKLDQWNEKLTTRRFCWAVLHRLRSRVGPSPLAPPDEQVRQAAAAMGTTRTFDMYYVTLRRSKSTNRYARQDPDPNRIPNPFSFVNPPITVEPAALPSDQDVMFPVAWRVQVQLPKSLAYDSAPAGSGKEPTRVSTEIQVPADGITGIPAALLVSMFPSGTMFVDEIQGHIYRVTKRRIVDALGEKAMLTLDREIVQEDIEIPLGDSRCAACTDTDWTKVPDLEELLRTVWVFPPSVDRYQPGDMPTFDGPSPVVDIEVGALSISPSS